MGLLHCIPDLVDGECCTGVLFSREGKVERGGFLGSEPRPAFHGSHDDECVRSNENAFVFSIFNVQIYKEIAVVLVKYKYCVLGPKQTVPKWKLD